MHRQETIYTPKSGQIIRWAGVFVPIFIILYAVLIKLDIIHTFRTIDNVSFIVLMAWWIIVSFLQFIAPTRNDKVFGWFLVVYHLLAGSYLVFISGTVTPLVACWSILAMFAYVHDSKFGFRLSILGLIAFITLDIALWYGYDNTVIIQDLIAFILTLIISGVTINISKTQEVSKLELAQSKIQESLQRDRFLTIINNLADAVISTDMDGVIRIYNAASLNLLDTNNPLNGHHINDILPLNDQNGNRIDIFQEIQNSKTVAKRDDLDYNFSDDDKIRLEITYSPIRSSYSRSKKASTHDGYIVIMRDVTKVKSLEGERDEFISVVSHELRTPIAIAEGTISNVQLMMTHPDATPKMLRDTVEIAHEQIIFLASMVNDLSTLSRAERGVYDDVEYIDVRELAHQLHSKYADEAKAKKLHLNLDLSPKLGKVNVSRLYIEELLQNLITNAIKYTKEGKIDIVVEQKGNLINFAVKDTGIGISKSDQPKLFNKFYRSEDYRTRETSGTGLGLYIAAKLAHKMGTKIILTSRLNFGSTFSFILPEAKQ